MPNENSPVTNNPKEESFYEKSEIELHMEQSKRIRKLAEALQEEKLNDYYNSQHCRPYARM